MARQPFETLIGNRLGRFDGLVGADWDPVGGGSPISSMTPFSPLEGNTRGPGFMISRIYTYIYIYIFFFLI